MRLTETHVSKTVRLLSLLPTRPVEFFDRIATALEVNREPAPRSLSNTVDFPDALTQALDVSREVILEILSESELKHIEEKVTARIQTCKRAGPFDSGHNGDFLLAKAIYVVCRLLSPKVVLETGVAYGVTSAFTLQALAVNRKGHLFSIDLPPLGKHADQNVGAFVPTELKDRWELHRGSVKRILPHLLREIGKVDTFVHDSLHTYRNMTFEFTTVWPSLRPPAVVIADDVGLNDAFRNFAVKVKPPFSAVIKEENKDAQFGVLVKRV
jgi:hypothetical protein